MNCTKYNPRTIKTRKMANYDVNKFKADLRKIPWDSIIDVNTICNAWTLFKQTLINIISNHAPLIEKRVKGRDCPWLTSDVKEKINNRDFLLKKARKSGKELDWGNYRKARNNVTKCIRQHKANYNRSLFRENVNRPKQFWSQIRKCFPTNTKQQATHKVFNINDEQISDKQVIADSFCKYFTEVAASIQRGYSHLLIRFGNFMIAVKFKKL